MNNRFEESYLILLFNSKLQLFLGKLRSRWLGSFKVINVFPYGAIEVWSEFTGAFKVNGQCLKPYYVGDPIDKSTVHTLFDPEPS